MSEGLEPAERHAPRHRHENLIDIHCHGALGHAFGDSEDGSRAAAAFLAEQGITQVVASLVSATDEVLERQVRVLASLVADGTLLGIHLEGPFLAPACRGAHDPAMLRDPDQELVRRLAAVAASAGAPGAIRQLTFAPERPGAAELITVLADLGIVPAIGHTAATADQVSEAVERVNDATGRPGLITHLFNGMPTFHHRSGGPAAAALAAAASGTAYLELIADGVHVAPEVVRAVFATVGAEWIVLISDAMAATGLGDGDYLLGSLPVRVTEGTARVVREDGSLGSIAGSTSTVADCLRWSIDVAGVPEAQAIRAATQTPAAAIGGTWSPGRD